MRKTIALDFDGVLHRYGKGWQDGSIYDEPIQGAQEACHALKAESYELVIFTARQQIPAIKEWLARYGFPPMEVTNTKPPALFYIDDRAIRFTDWRMTLVDIETLTEKAGQP